jgi:hypothetical protein
LVAFASADFVSEVLSEYISSKSSNPSWEKEFKLISARAEMNR